MSVLFIFLGILKIILYIILIILFITLLLLGIVLFIPIKYKAEVNKNEKTYATLNVTWFFSLVKLDCSYKKGKTKVKAKAFLWTIFGDKKVKSKTEKKVDNTNKTIPDQKKENETSSQPIIKENQMEEKTSEKFEDDKSDFSNEKYNKEGFISKVKSFCGKIIYVKDYPNRVEIQNLTWVLIKKICERLKPSIFTLYGEIGFADPSVTGCMLGGIYALSALIGADLKVKGDFDREILEFKLVTKGSFMLWSIVFPLIKYIWTKPIWKLVKKFIFS